jgi:hypothetical protein
VDDRAREGDNGLIEAEGSGGVLRRVQARERPARCGMDPNGTGVLGTGLALSQVVHAGWMALAATGHIAEALCQTDAASFLL